MGHTVLLSGALKTALNKELCLIFETTKSLKILHKYAPLILTGNVSILQEMHGNHDVTFNSDMSFFVSFHTEYSRGALRVKKGWQEEKKYDMCSLCSPRG